MPKKSLWSIVDNKSLPELVIIGFICVLIMTMLFYIGIPAILSGLEMREKLDYIEATGNFATDINKV